MTGRPTKRTDKLVDEIIAAVSEGITLREICRRKEISVAAFNAWKREDEELSSRFARARDEGFDAIAEETVEIADDGTNDWVERERDDGSTYMELDREHVQRSKLRIETRLKLLAKWDPKRYGDKLDVTSDGKALGDRAAALAAARERADSE